MIFNKFAVFLLLSTHMAIATATNEDIRIAEQGDKAFESSLTKIFTNYNPGTRPNVTGAPVLATISLLLIKIEEIEEVHETFTADFYLRTSWNDYRLRHNQSKIVLAADEVKKIWSPDIFFPNALRSDAPKVTKKNQLVLIDGNGDVFHSVRVTVVANCHLHLRSFPLDHQMCYLHLESYAYSTRDLILEWTNSTPVIIDDTRMPGYVVESIDTAKGDTGYVSGAYSRLSLITTYERLLGYYIFQIYVPCMLIVISSWLSFWLNAHEPGDRVALAITTILAIVFILQFISTTLPRVSYAKGIDYYLVGCFVQIFLGLLETVVATNYVKSQAKNKDALKTKVSVDSAACDELNIKKQQHHNVLADEISLDEFTGNMDTRDQSKRDFQTDNKDEATDEVNLIDRVSRVAFPLTFALFNACYWILYIYFIKPY